MWRKPLSINLSVTEAGPSKNEYVCIEVSSRKRIDIKAMIGCWYQSIGQADIKTKLISESRSELISEP